MPGRLCRVALTGGIATGKSYCLARFVDLGAASIDADVLAKQAIAPGTPGFDAVVARFGSGVRKPDGSLDRQALGRLVFADDAARRDLEAIVHPAVYQIIESWFQSLRQTGEATVIGIADIPLLYETGRDEDFDRVIVTRCEPPQQLERLMKRPGISEEDARRRIESQMPVDEKAARANYVIDTSGSHEETNLQVLDVWEKLRRGS